jgi:hypothetical protein
MRLRKFAVLSLFVLGCSGTSQTSGVPDGTGGTGTDGTSGTAGDGGNDGGSSGRGGSIGPGGTTFADAATLDAGNPGVRPPRPDPLCDGSTDIRLLIYETGGRGTFPRFGVPFGHRFAFVDGQCRFFAGSRYTLGYRSGVLTSEQAADVARETRWAELPALDGLQTEQCPDAGSRVLTDGEHVAHWRGCGDGPGFGMLASLGPRLDGPVLVATAPEAPPRATATLLPWTIAREPSAFADVDSEDPWSVPGVRVTDTADVARLRQLRAQVVFDPPYEHHPFYVTTGDGGPTYAAYVREVVPNDMRSAI